MAVILLLYLMVPAILVALLWVLKVRAKRYLLGLPIVVLCLPVFLGVGLYLFRTPIQQGQFLPALGPLLNLVFPAEDLYSPLIEEPLSAGRNRYNFKFSHKYLGNHAVFIEVPSNTPPEFKIEKGLHLTVNINEGRNALLSKDEDLGSPFFGKGRYGFYYIGYKVPRDVPVAKEISMEIRIDNDIHQFLMHHEEAKIIVRKSSDE